MLTFLAMFSALILLLIIGVPVAISMISASVVVLGFMRGWEDIPFSMIAQRTLYG